MAICSPNSLMLSAAAFGNMDERQMKMCIIQILCDISASGGGGGGTQRVFHGPTNPNGIVVAPDPSIYYGDNGSLWVKTNGLTDSSGWQPLIAGTGPAPVLMASFSSPNPNGISAANVFTPGHSRESVPVSMDMVEEMVESRIKFQSIKMMEMQAATIKSIEDLKDIIPKPVLESTKTRPSFIQRSSRWLRMNLW